MAVTAGAAQLLVLVPMIGIVADDAGQSAAAAGGGQPANGGNDLQLVEVGVCARIGCEICACTNRSPRRETFVFYLWARSLVYAYKCFPHVELGTAVMMVMVMLLPAC